MSWLLLIALLAFGIAWWRWHREFLRHWHHLERLVDELAEGKRPSSFVFYDSPRFTRLASKFESVSDHSELLKKQLAEEKFNFQAILAGMNEGVMVVDNGHVIRLVNESFNRQFNLKSDPSGSSALGALRNAAIEEVIRVVLENGVPASKEINVIQHTQQPPMRFFAMSAVPIRDARNRPSGVVSVFHDITRLRQLEEIRREFVANVSHELRTPLSIFHGYLENLLDAPEMPGEELVEILKVMRKHSHRLNALLEDLLTLARLESRQEPLELSEVQVEPFIRQIVREWQNKFGEKQIAVSVEVSPDLPMLLANEFRLEQVISNLLENAIKFTPGEGRIHISASATDSQIEIRVADTGIGIPPAALSHIFERFYRVEKARSRDAGGTGLGLSIVKHIVELHGGTVEARSVSGHGTEIVLRFPR